MRRTLRSLIPSHEAIHGSPWLRPFRKTLLHPRLWHLNRHSAAGGVAVGLFCGLIPGPFQMLGAAIACVLWRVNLPLAMITTLYSNPITIVPLYIAAYAMGAILLGQSPSGFVHPPEMNGMGFIEWSQTLLPWAVGLGKPLLFGLVVLAMTLAVAGYLSVRATWRIWLIRTWRTRNARRNKHAQLNQD